MHVLHIIDSLARGGAERMLVDIANVTAAAGRSVSVCVTRSNADLAPDLRPDIGLLVLNRRRRFDWVALRRLARYCQRQMVTVIHAHGQYSAALALLVRLRHRLATPIILHDHSGEPLPPPLWFRLLGRWALRHVVRVSDQALDWGQIVGMGPERRSIIHNSLDLTRLEQVQPRDVRAEYGIAPQQRVGVLIGGIRHVKGVDRLLTMLNAHPDREAITLLIVGGEREPEFAGRCRQQVREEGLENRVHFLGERADVLDIIASADFALMTSRSESGPLVLIEYAYLGVPFVAFAVGSVARRMQALGLPGLVAADDQAAFIMAWGRLLAASEADVCAWQQSVRQIVRDHFDIQQQLPHWLAIYDAVVAD